MDSSQKPIFPRAVCPQGDSLQATVVGIYGLPGSGKTYLVNRLVEELGRQDFCFYEGSELISSVVPGGLCDFEAMQDEDKEHWRRCAIRSLKSDHHNNGKTVVVTGHLMFWSKERAVAQPVYTSDDLNTFTHILYLDVSTDEIFLRRRDDSNRRRPELSKEQLGTWQEAEKTQLSDICLQHGILLLTAPSNATLQRKASSFLRNVRLDSEDANLRHAENTLNDAVGAHTGQVETVLVLDADRTLIAEDTGLLFWQAAARRWPQRNIEHRLRNLFSSSLGYSYFAFRQAALYYEEIISEGKFDDICQSVVSAVRMHPEFVSLLQVVAEQKHARAVIVTCGLQCVWEGILRREGISDKVKVIGGGFTSEDLVITPAVKAAAVIHLQTFHQMRVMAFGDSPLDLDMLAAADEAVVVVGEEDHRSNTMDAALASVIDSNSLSARQVVLPSHAPARLNESKLPIFKLTDPAFLKSALRDRRTCAGLQVLCCTSKDTAKLLATPMRNASIGGPVLRKAHRNAGWYLAVEYVVKVIGLEQSEIQHVLNRQTKGYQLLHEPQTTIVALMRGGEPMATGVSDAFPQAMFVHAKVPFDLKFHHLERQISLILVDSVVNTGKSIIEFVQHARQLHATIRIIIIAGVVQVECLHEQGLRHELAQYSNIHLISLRHSDTKFVGSGTTDTGNRLFNTTRLP